MRGGVWSVKRGRNLLNGSGAAQRHFGQCLFRRKQEAPAPNWQGSRMKVTLLAATLIIAIALLLAPAFVKAPPVGRLGAEHEGAAPNQR